MPSFRRPEKIAGSLVSIDDWHKLSSPFISSAAPMRVWKLKQNCSAPSFEGKAFPRVQEQQPRETFLTAPPSLRG